VYLMLANRTTQAMWCLPDWFIEEAIESPITHSLSFTSQGTYHQ
jgi:hypothetical protein